MELPFGLRELLGATELPADDFWFDIDGKLFVGLATNDNADFDRRRTA